MPGTLSFEFSRGTQRIVINCGAPASRHHHLRRAARRTAAHSTAILNEESSSRFSSPAVDAQIISGPRDGDRASATIRTTARRLCRRATTAMSAASAWCMSGAFGSSPTAGCSRAWTASPANRCGRPAFAVRFHLHHAVAVHATDRRTALDLRLPDGSVWRFEANGPVELEESVHLSDVFGSRPTHQIVLAGKARSEVPVKWRLTLLAELC